MDQALRDEIYQLRGLSSPEAFEWLVQNRPSLPRSVAHRSWAVAEQEALLSYYLTGKIPFASASGYQWLEKATSLSQMIKHISKLLPSIPQDRLFLLEYHLRPVLMEADRTERQRDEAQILLREIRKLIGGYGLDPPMRDGAIIPGGASCE
ncbi:MAG TPA: hypothetical protein VNQ78_21380 [Paracoccus sp. (in: a-proteobacteria)]|uniref:hypothetical protein n=1 Tax=Paracoccus sp. TaxID=267 RepID=UPI002BD425CD|nr:hypothetical protein [Paracoccus sp. (in: a-proteobacteria)]HWL59214.1 hypothetical protein [Paracoccus sp. (in: a-proteobacteria)]